MAPPRRQRIGLVADGYGLTPGIGRGVRALLSAGRLSGVSVMAGLPQTTEEARLLNPFARDADIGLHLFLTEFEPLTVMPKLAPDGRLPAYRPLAVAALTGQFPRAGGLPLPEIKAELNRQYDRFLDLFGRPPDHIDSHRHIHVLPGVREAVIDLIRDRTGGRAYVRSLSEAGWAILERGVARGKALGLAYLSRSLESLAGSARLSTNHGFAGLPGGGPRHYAERFDRFLMGISEGGLIACQPGQEDAPGTAPDPYARWRAEQLEFLSGPVMPGLIDRAGLRIARLSRVLGEEP